MWYIIWRYAIDPTKRMKRGRAVLIWRVDVQGRGGRTHTFGIASPKAKLERAIIYQAPGVVLYRGKPTLGNGY